MHILTCYIEYHPKDVVSFAAELSRIGKPLRGSQKYTAAVKHTVDVAF